MNFKDAFFLPMGNVAVITADALLTGGYYQELGAPGGTDGAVITIAASETVKLGPYNTNKSFLIAGDNGAIAVTKSFSAYNPSTEPLNTFDLGTKNGATVTAVEKLANIKHTRLVCAATPITLTDDGGNGQYGGVKVYTFPEGLINCMGAVVKGTLTTLTGTFITTFASVVALGTVTATTGNTLTSTEADIMPSNANTAAVANVAAVAAKSLATALTESGARWLNGTGTAIPMFLNFLITDDASHTSGTAEFTGTIDFFWTNLGDV